MGSYSDLNITIRRKDFAPVTKEDLEKFESYFFEDFRDLRWREETCYPFICSNGQNIFASCTIKWTLERQDFQQFASANPHLQIEIMENSEHDGGTETRYLYEGDIFEVCDEVRYFEEPKKINWPSYHAGDAYKLEMQLRALEDNHAFHRWLGNELRRAFLADTSSDAGLGEDVLRGYVGGRLDELFIALTGMGMDDLLERWNESQTYQEVTK